MAVNIGLSQKQRQGVVEILSPLLRVRRAGSVRSTGRFARSRAGGAQARRCGSRRSRSPSPRRFAPRTTSEIAAPGTVASHQAFDR
jgi:hypothetical protein